MTSFVPDGCCVASLEEPVQILTLSPPSSSQPGSTLELFSDAASLDKYLTSSADQDYSCRFISICQDNSWRAPGVTRPMLSLLIDAHGFSPNISDLTASFYTKNNDLEDSFCTPFTVSSDGPWFEILYTIPYPEFKESEEEWSIRQTGVCHRINTETQQSIFLLLSPKPNSKSHETIYEHLTEPSNQLAGNTGCALHDVLLKAHTSAWRPYNKACEAEFLPISNTTFATYIDEPLRIGYNQLSALSSLEARFIVTSSLVSSTNALLEDLLVFLVASPSVIDPPRRGALIHSLQSQLRHCAASMRCAGFLQARVRVATQLLANTLSFRDQVIANEQNDHMLQLNKSAVFITMLTLMYAPASYVVTFFGMNFFAMDQPNSRIISYIVTTLVFTSATVVFYYWLLRHDGVLLGRLAPKVPVNKDWKGFVRRLTILDSSVELRPVTLDFLCSFLFFECLL